MQRRNVYDTKRPKGRKINKDEIPIGSIVKHYILPDHHGDGKIIERKVVNKRMRGQERFLKHVEYFVHFEKSGYFLWLRSNEVFLSSERKTKYGAILSEEVM